jgi:diketogulonate reductase-like aldo/keto reductase
MTDSMLVIDRVRIPRFIYGTAWKEESTQRLTEMALQSGFRGVDTANQRKHYDEAAVGEAIKAVISRGSLTREQLFLQTKFTFRGGQDHRLPYDPDAPIGVQVEQSFISSLEHLQTERLDAYLLHGPSLRIGLSQEDWDAWHAMEELHDGGCVGLLGISNVSVEQLRSLYEGARVKPRIVQNRCYASRRWDFDVRAFCRECGLVYEGFSLLTANRQVLARPEIAAVAAKYGRTIPQIIFRFALDAGMVPLTGTTDAVHMREDLQAFGFQLTAEEIRLIESAG